MPLSGAAASLFLKDYQGVLQLALATGVVQGTTEVLKQVVNERRPNGHCCSSFPSGHTSLAFTGASFVHFRYGFKYSIPLYIGSMYVAYNRVQIKAHHIYDVAFGAGLAVAGTYLSTTKYKLDGVSIAVSGGYAGIIYRKVFD
ncbi:MAG: phosphatase PAP2 family protein [Legionellales bacterium]|nr:phosphatase PAP2 family protein [Legionellales bacterium]